MALYKNAQHLATSTDVAFDAIHQPGVAAPHPGIYRCAGCGDEIAIAGGHALPPQNHHQHAREQGEIRWQLLVFPVSKK